MHGHAQPPKPACDARPDLPEIGERTVLPQLLAKGQRIELRHTHAVTIGGNVFGNDVHRDFRKVEIRPHAACGSDALGAQHVADDGRHQLARRRAVKRQIRCQVKECLVDGIDVNVLRRRIFEVNAIDLRRNFQIAGHARHGDDHVYLLPGAGTDLSEPLSDLEQPGPPGHTERLERRRNSQADRFV